MTGTIGSLLMAVVAFVGAHFLLSSRPVRGVIAEKVGAGPFLGIYSLAAGITMAWMVLAYKAAPYREIWAADGTMLMIPSLAMPLAAILVVCSITSKLPTAVGGETTSDDPNPVRGIATVTRHPMLCGTALWSFSHMAANGDEASLILMGGILVLSIGGMFHIDHRRQAAMGGEWGPIALSTSMVPFMAALQGRVKIDWAGIGLWRVALGLAVYGGLMFAHPWLAGVPVLPH